MSKLVWLAAVTQQRLQQYTSSRSPTLWCSSCASSSPGSLFNASFFALLDPFPPFFLQLSASASGSVLTAGTGTVLSVLRCRCLALQSGTPQQQRVCAGGQTTRQKQHMHRTSGDVSGVWAAGFWESRVGWVIGGGLSRVGHSCSSACSLYKLYGQMTGQSQHVRRRTGDVSGALGTLQQGFGRGVGGGGGLGWVVDVLQQRACVRWRVHEPARPAHAQDKWGREWGCGQQGFGQQGLGRVGFGGGVLLSLG